MARRRVIVLQNDETWNHFLCEAFEDTISTPEIVRSTSQATPLIQKGHPDVVFVNTGLLTRPLVAALQMHRSSNRHFRAFRLGLRTELASAYPFDDSFNEIPTLYDFQRLLTQHLPLPEKIRLLVVDDEVEVGRMFQDYFNGRMAPTFEIEVARNGIEGEERIEKNPPDILVMDIKMPERDGKELFRRLKEKGIQIPTVVFSDLVSADEVLEIRRWGSPAFVEKGSRSSAMPEIAGLIKKLAYFG